MSPSDFISIIGCAISLIGFGFTIYQVKQARKVSEASRDAIEDTRRTIEHTLSVLDVTKHIEAIKLAQEALSNNHIDVCLIYLRELRTLLIDLRESPLFIDMRQTFGEHQINVGRNIHNLAEYADNPDMLNKTVLRGDLERLSEELTCVQSKLKHNTL